MHGDFTRSTFKPEKHYWGVLEQQGRVQLDADWNEQVAIDAHLREASLQDLIGTTGAPLTGGGFKVLPSFDGLDLLVAPGRFYVDGILCEAEAGYEVEIFPVTVGPSPWVTVFVAALRASGLALNDSVQVVGESSPERTPLAPFYVQLLEIEEPGPGDPTRRRIRLSQNFFQSRGLGRQRIRRPATYLHQPHLPGSQLPTPERTYLVYLDVWTRHITALEDPEIRDVALGGPDTATRAQTVWQVKLFEVAEAEQASASFCVLNPEGWTSHVAPSSGRLSARTNPPPQPDSLCVVPTDAGYTLLENQFYRVEVHRGSDSPGGPTFKWSRDNGKVVMAWQPQDAPDPNRIKVASLGSDEVLGLQKGQWIELMDDRLELEGKPGLLVKINDVDGETLEIDPLGQTVTLSDFTLNPKLRRWDHPATAGKDGLAASAGGWIPLEGSLEIGFDFDRGDTLRTGDYWQIPARAFIGEHHGSIEWPQDSQKDPLPLPPQGIRHHYARLAVADFRTAGLTEVEPPDLETGNLEQSDTSRVAPQRRPPPQPLPTTFRGATDCRRLFPAATQLLRFILAGGDGQEALPGAELACPLEVAVQNGPSPVEGAQVGFSTDQGSLRTVTEQETPAQPGAVVVVQTKTDSSGVARCWWKLPQSYPRGGPECLTVTAFLINAVDQMQITELRFHANVSVASQVAYDPGSCIHLQGSATVQDALDKLCANIDLADVGGDGQTGLPGKMLALPLGVRVSNGHSAHPGGTVEFKVERGSGKVSRDQQDTDAGMALRVLTNAEGLAYCFWTLDASTPSPVVSARLLYPGLDRTDAVVYFGAALSLASQVAYDPAACTPLRDAHADTVQEALDELCRRLPQELPHFFVQSVSFTSGPEVLNDSVVTAEQLATGLRIVCTEPIAPESVGGVPGLSTAFPSSVPAKPTCFVTLAVPIGGPGSTETSFQAVAFSTFLLHAKVSSSGSTILWQPTDAMLSWLRAIFSSSAPDALLGSLTLEGNCIWTPGPDGQPAKYLAGKPLGRPAPGGRVDLIRFPSDLTEAPHDPSQQRVVGTNGTGQAGAIRGSEPAGPFTMWFWVTRPRRQPKLTVTPQATAVAGVVRDDANFVVRAVAVTLARGNTIQNTTTTDNNGSFIFKGLSPGTYTVSVELDGTKDSKPAIISPTNPNLPTEGPPITTLGQRSLAAPAEPLLREVSGLGPAFSAQLEERGITTPAAVAKLRPARLAKILSISEGRARTLIESAKRLLQK